MEAKLERYLDTTSKEDRRHDFVASLDVLISRISHWYKYLDGNEINTSEAQKLAQEYLDMQKDKALLSISDMVILGSETVKKVKTSMVTKEIKNKTSVINKAIEQGILDIFLLREETLTFYNQPLGKVKWFIDLENDISEIHHSGLLKELELKYQAKAK